jgi:hypothetical protein
VDEKWVDERIKYQLIRSLMEALKSLRRIRHLKVIVAMRTDVLATVIAKSEQPGLQRDKYDDFIVDLEWGQKELRALVDKRVRYLYRRKYTKDNVLFSDIFSRQVSQKPAFDYMIERTLLRPRDIISFTNLALGAAQGKNEVPAKDIKDAEARYSKQRYEALTQEWIVAFPWLRDAFRILRVGATRFSVSAIPGALIEDFVAALLSEDTRNSEIHRLAKRAVEAKGSGSMSVVVFEALAVLYRIGAVGLKLNANERYRYAYIDNATVNATDIDLDTKVHIHPMLQRALGVYDDQRTGRSSD